MGPFIKSKNTTDKMMKNLLIALLPIVIFTFYKNGIIPYINDTTDIIGLFYPLIFIAISMFSTFIFELIISKIMKKESHYSIIPGLFIALVLPINTPIEILIFGCFMAIFIGKMIYGGFGNNIFNPALIGCLFITVAYSGVITSNGGYLNSYEVDTISGATPLSNVVEGIGSYDTLVKPYGNLWNFFLGFIPGSVGETSSLLCLIGLIYLGIKKVIKINIPIIYISTVFILTFIIGSINGLGIWYPLYQIFSGGLMFGAIYMATDPVTSPTTKLGQVIYGFALGILTVMFRYLTGYPEGVLSSILLMNMFVFILDKIGIRDKNIIKKTIISLLVILVFAASIVIKVNDSYKVSDIDSDFEILEKNIDGDRISYIVTQKGFKGKIKAHIVIKNTEVLEYSIIECNDDYLSVVENADYISKLKNSDDLKNIDTVSGATKTSTALKKMIINVMKDSGNYEK